MADYYRDLIKKLKAENCRFVRNGKGDHEIWFSPKTNINFAIDKGSNNRHMANKALREAGFE